MVIVNTILCHTYESSKNYPSGTVGIRGKGRPYQWKRPARYLRCFWYKNSFSPYGHPSSAQHFDRFYLGLQRGIGNTDAREAQSPIRDRKMNIKTVQDFSSINT